MNERKLSKAAIEDVYDSAWKCIQPYIETEKITVRYLDEKGWDFAIDVQRSLDISASDAIHVAVAFNYGCDIFVTSDNQLIRICSEYFDPKRVLFSTPYELKKKEQTLEKKTLIIRKARPIKS